jgi:hypothetical protein
MVTAWVLAHIFTHAGTRFVIVSHQEILHFCFSGDEDQPARLERVPKELLFLSYG